MLSPLLLEGPGNSCRFRPRVWPAMLFYIGPTTQVLLGGADTRRTRFLSVRTYAWRPLPVLTSNVENGQREQYAGTLEFRLLV